MSISCKQYVNIHVPGLSQFCFFCTKLIYEKKPVDLYEMYRKIIALSRVEKYRNTLVVVVESIHLLLFKETICL